MLIYLTGPRACGKTSLGQELAAALGLPFVDTDQRLRERSGEEVADIVAREGWEGFRRRESAILRDVAAELEAASAGKPATDGAAPVWSGVVATGGGMVLAEENRRFMARDGTGLLSGGAGGGAGSASDERPAGSAAPLPDRREPDRRGGRCAGAATSPV